MASRLWVFGFSGFALVACSAPSAPPAKQPASSAPAATSTPAPSSSCAGLQPHTCAQTAGCILDQKNAILSCRAAANSCEAAVVHAALIGPYADPTVTPEAMTQAQATCEATPGCAVSSGACSCPGGLLGDMDCVCGHGIMRRCAKVEDLSWLNAE